MRSIPVENRGRGMLREKRMKGERGFIPDSAKSELATEGMAHNVSKEGRLRITRNDNAELNRFLQWDTIHGTNRTWQSDRLKCSECRIT